VLSRALCRYRVFPLLDDSSPAKRLAAIDLKIAEWSPWPDTARLVHEDGKRIGVWIWDRAAVSAQIVAAGLRPERVTVMPETALQPRGTGGLRHVKTLDGSEGQWWQGGLLAASRWWPEPPDRGEWVRFQRAAGVPPDAASDGSSNPLVLDELPRPWLSGNTLRSGASMGRRLAPAYWALAAGYVLLIGVYAGQAIANQIVRNGVDADVAEAAKTAQPRVAERAEALSALDAVVRLQALSPYPTQLDLFVKLADILPRNGTKLTQWSFQAGELEFTVVAPTGIEAPAYVKVLQNVPGFADVSAEHVGNDKTLKVKLRVLAT
jgi:hypothetical protein